jgi:hypothetical protein
MGRAEPINSPDDRAGQPLIGGLLDDFRVEQGRLSPEQTTHRFDGLTILGLPRRIGEKEEIEELPSPAGREGIQSGFSMDRSLVGEQSQGNSAPYAVHVVLSLSRHSTSVTGRPVLVILEMGSVGNEAMGRTQSDGR